MGKNKWCWQDEAPTESTDTPPAESETSPEDAEKAALADEIAELSWTWAEFEKHVLKMPWDQWERLKGTVEAARQRLYTHIGRA